VYAVFFIGGGRCLLHNDGHAGRGAFPERLHCSATVVSRFLLSSLVIEIDGGACSIIMKDQCRIGKEEVTTRRFLVTFGENSSSLLMRIILQ
jgi:hypothetical protein